MDLLLEQVRELWAERARVGWVALGVAWGTLSLTLLVAFGNGFVVGTTATIGNFGENLLRIAGGSTTRPFEGLAAGRSIELHVEDEALLRSGVPQASAVALEYCSGSGHPLRHGEQKVNAPISGCGPVFRDIRGMRPQPGGRFINELDVKQRRRVCFLGQRLKERLFGQSRAVGETVELHGTPFTVIGVRQSLVAVSSYEGDDRDKIVIPHTTLRALLGWTQISHLFVKLREPELKQSALGSIYSALGKRYRFDPLDTEALDVNDYIAIESMIHGMLDGNRYFNGVVGFFGLLVAMLGVMNVMYTMVEERTQEIGVRMALGACPREIARERLMESLLVTLLGGAVGIFGCWVLLTLVNRIPMDAEVRAYVGHPALSVGLALTVTVTLSLAGCFAGWYPAQRAASLDPVEALREE